MARMRMSVLYDRSVTWGGLVVGTGNKTESLIGYTTIFGDSACAFNPVGDLYKSQVRQLAAAMDVPDSIIAKAPSADLWPGQTDEIESGFSYPELDRLLFWRIDKRRSIDEVVALGFERRPGRAGRSDGRRRRVQAPGAADRQARAADGGRRLPVPAPAAGVGTRSEPRRRGRGGPVGGARGRRRRLGRQACCTSWRRRSGTCRTSRCERWRCSAAVPLIAAEDTRLSKRLLDRHGIAGRLTSYHARSGPGGWRRCWSTCAGAPTSPS